MGSCTSAQVMPAPPSPDDSGLLVPSPLQLGVENGNTAGTPDLTRPRVVKSHMFKTPSQRCLDALHANMEFTPKDTVLRKQFKYYCPICFSYYKHMFQTNCCSHSMCNGCGVEHVNNRLGGLNEYHEVPAFPMSEVNCPFCGQMGLSFRLVLHNASSLRSYVDSPMVAQARQDTKDEEIQSIANDDPESPALHTVCPAIYTPSVPLPEEPAINEAFRFDQSAYDEEKEPLNLISQAPLPIGQPRLSPRRVNSIPPLHPPVSTRPASSGSRKKPLQPVNVCTMKAQTPSTSSTIQHVRVNSMSKTDDYVLPHGSPRSIVRHRRVRSENATEWDDKENIPGGLYGGNRSPAVKVVSTFTAVTPSLIR